MRFAFKFKFTLNMNGWRFPKTWSKVANGTATVVVLGAKTVNSVLGLPMMDTGLALVDHIVKICKQISNQNDGIQTLLRTCEELRPIFQVKDIDKGLMQEKVDEAVSILKKTHKAVVSVKKCGKLQRYAQHDDIARQLAECDQALNRILKIFNVASHISNRMAINEFSAKVDERLVELTSLVREISQDKKAVAAVRKDPVLSAQYSSLLQADSLQFTEVSERKSPKDYARDEKISPENVEAFQELVRKIRFDGLPIITDQVQCDFNIFDCGTYMVIYEGRYNGAKVAIKCTFPRSKYERDLRRFAREVTVMSMARHEFILPIFGLIKDEIHGVGIVSPWQENGNLKDYMENHDPPFFTIMAEVAEGLQYLHNFRSTACSEGICHGNIKCSNILISEEGHPLICEFKMAQLLDPVPSSTVSDDRLRTVGRWSAPEIIKREKGAKKESDIWSFAMTIIEALTLTRPYDYLEDDDVYVGLAHGKLYPSRPTSGRHVKRWLTDDLWMFMLKCWARREASRPKIKEVTKKMRELECRSPANPATQSTVASEKP